MAAPANTTSSPTLSVVCAFPLSSNYGPGSRVSPPQYPPKAPRGQPKCSQMSADSLLCPGCRMCDFSKSRMAAQRLLGCCSGSTSDICASGPRARVDACEWSAYFLHPRLSRQFLTSTTLGAVDMDIYGAFQFCSIGILAAPLTVRLSRTYFYDPGRNIIFLWTILILMGLVSSLYYSFRRSLTLTSQPCL